MSDDATNQTSDAMRVDATLDALLVALDALEASLHDELTAIGSAETAPLLDAVEHKRQALHRVDTLTRDPLLGPLVDSTSEASAAPVIQHAKWPLVLERLAACRSLNQAAGGALASARQSTDETLRLLGRTPAHDTYAGDGTPSNATPAQRNLATC